MKIAIIHEYLNQYGGAERTLREIFMPLFPDATIFSLFYNKKRFTADPHWKIQTSFLQYLPAINNYKFYFPLFPFAIRSLRFPDHDLLLSSSSAFAKNIKKPKHTLHICYCHTPMRYAWDLKDQYIKDQSFLLRLPLRIFLSLLRWWDKKNTTSVDYFIANSNHVKQRIKNYYQRDSTVIYSAVDCNKYTPRHKKQDFYLLVSRLIKPKKVELAVRAFSQLGKKLVIIGSGREEQHLKQLATPNISFLGYLPDERLIAYYQRAKALIFPGLEDFGMTPLEAQACGTPVIAFGKGGVLETVLEGKTGYFFHEQTPESLIRAVLAFERKSFKPLDCRKQALRFDASVFKRQLKTFIEQKYKEFYHVSSTHHH